jgi:hypothetical protein
VAAIVVVVVVVAVEDTQRLGVVDRHQEGTHQEDMHQEDMHQEGMHQEGTHQEGTHQEGRVVGRPTHRHRCDGEEGHSLPLVAL